MAHGESHASLGLEEAKYRRFAAVVSLLVGGLLMLAKFWAHRLTNSQAVFSDALESIINVVAAVLALFVIYYSAKPIDEDHPYGHGKVEYFSEAFEGGLIAFAAVFIMVESVIRFFSDHQLQQINLGLAIVAGAGVINLLLGLFLLRIGKRTNSVALKASGHHVISDFVTSVGVIGGLILVMLTGYSVLDLVAAFVVGIYLAFTGVKLVRESVSGLMDEEDLDLLEKMAETFTKYATRGVIQVHHVKVIRSGWYHHIDAHLVVPEFWTIDQVHDNVEKFEASVLSDYDQKGELNYHLDPCRKAYCRVCDMPDCPIRVKPFEKRMPVVLEHLRSKEEPEEYRDPNHKH